MRPYDEPWRRNQLRQLAAIFVGMVGGILATMLFIHFVLAPLGLFEDQPVLSFGLGILINIGTTQMALRMTRKVFCVHSDLAVGHEKAKCRFCGRVRHILHNESARQP